MGNATDQVAGHGIGLVASPGQQAGARARHRLALDFGGDRETAFRRALWHTRWVRVMRVVLPVIAVALFGSYGLFVQRSVKISTKKGSFSVDSATISTEALVARNPKYEGFDSQGGRFVVHAATAEQDFNQKGPVRLKVIDGQMIDVNKSVTDLKARSGTYDTKTSVLELYEKIDVVSQSGMVAALTRATVYSKENRIVSNEPVTVTMPTGVVRGNTLLIEQKKRQITFDQGVKARLKQAQTKPGAAAANPASGPGAGQTAEGSAFTASDAPVDITSKKLFIDDLTKLAVFQGDVIAKQNDSTLETEELEVSYEGQQAADGAPKPPASDLASSSKLKKLVSHTDVVLTRGVEKATGKAMEYDAVSDHATLLGNVVITSGPDRQATSERAEMDNKRDTALLTGASVVLTQLHNVLKGRRLFVDRKAGTMVMTAPAEAGLPKGRISARMYQGDPEAAKKGAGGWSSATSHSGKAAEPEKGAGSPLTLKSDPSQPIDIVSDTLDVNDKLKTAIFRVNVHAVQGDYTMKTDELVVTYSGDSGMVMGQNGQLPPARPDPKAKAPGEQGTQLKKVQATKPVLVTTKDGRNISGQSADFDPKANFVTIIGDVKMVQGQSILVGSRATLDMNSGLMHMDQAPAPASTAAGAGAIPAAPPRQRQQAVLFPNKDGKHGGFKIGTPGSEAQKPAAQSDAKAGTASPATAQAPAARRSDGWSGNANPFDRIGQ